MFSLPSKDQYSGGSCRIKVNGHYNVQRLRRHLRHFGIRTSSPVNLEGTANYILQIRGAGRVSDFRLRQLMAGFPYIQLYG